MEIDVHKIELHSMTDLAVATEKAKAHYETNTKWVGGEKVDEVISKLKNGGDIKLVEGASKYLDKFNMAIATEIPIHQPSPFGGRFIIPEAILGWPEPARKLTRNYDDAAPLTVYFSNTCSGGIDVNQMIERGMAIMAFVMAMSYIRPVRVIYFSELGGNTEAKGWVNVTYEVPTSPMSLSEAAYCMSSMALTRGSAYAIGQHAGMGYHGQWAEHYTRLGGDKNDPKYIDYLRGALGAAKDDLIIGSVYLGDPLIKDPAGWLQKTINHYTGER
jgi:hypothetical protein